MCGLPVLAVAAEPGVLRRAHSELIVRCKREASERGFLPWSVHGLPMLAGFFAEKQLAKGIECKSSRAAGYACLQGLFVWQFGLHRD